MKNFLLTLAGMACLCFFPSMTSAAGIGWGADEPAKAASCPCTVATGSCPCLTPAAKAPAPTVQMVTTYQQVCDGRTCRLVAVQTPVSTAAPSQSFSLPAPMAFTAAPMVCGPNGCSQASAASFQTTTATTTQTSSSQCGTASTGPVRRILGRVFHQFGGRFSRCGG